MNIYDVKRNRHSSVSAVELIKICSIQYRDSLPLRYTGCPGVPESQAVHPDTVIERGGVRFGPKWNQFGTKFDKYETISFQLM